VTKFLPEGATLLYAAHDAKGYARDMVGGAAAA
jgi:hypothetical protein